MAFRIHVHRDLTGSDLKNIASYLKDGSTSATPADGAIIDFNKFCCIGESIFKIKTLLLDGHHLLWSAK